LSVLKVREEPGDAENARSRSEQKETEAQSQSTFGSAGAAQRRVEETDDGEPDPEAAQGLVGIQGPRCFGRLGIEEALRLRPKTCRLGRETRENGPAQRHERKRDPQRDQRERRQKARAFDGTSQEEAFPREIELDRSSSAGARQEDLHFGTRLSPGKKAQREKAHDAR
jgi:hypothetical protein